MAKKTSIITLIQCPMCTRVNCEIYYAPSEDDDNYCVCPDCGYEQNEDEFTWVHFEVGHDE